MGREGRFEVISGEIFDFSLVKNRYIGGWVIFLSSKQEPVCFGAGTAGGQNGIDACGHAPAKGRTRRKNGRPESGADG